MKNGKCLHRSVLTITGAAAFYLISFTAFALPWPPVPSIDWQPCGPEFPSAECAMVEVPLDYDRPYGKKISLALARVPASNPEEKIGSLFVNPGGPGHSGIEMALYVSFSDYVDEATDGRFDLVGFDPRGIGASTPIRCFESQAEFDEFFDGYPAFPYSEEQEWPYFVRYNEYTDECLQKNWEIARHMGTGDVARDLDLLRRAVGDPQLNYLGFSYGSYLGNTYANLFPMNVRAMVIDGVVNPIWWTLGLHTVSTRTSIQAAWDEFARLCDEAGPENCAATGPEGTLSRWEALIAALREEPLILPDGSVYTYDFIIAAAMNVLYRTHEWADAAVFIDQLAIAVLEKDMWAAEAALDMHRVMAQRYNKSRLSGDGYQNSQDALYGNKCGDTQFPFYFPAYSAMGEYAEQGSVFGPAWWWSAAPCASWPTAQDRYFGPWTTWTSNPVLVVGNYYDPVTPYEGAVASSELLVNSRLLSYAGWGHSAFYVSDNDCVKEYVGQYLLDGSLPEEGTVCPANPNPFLPALAKSQDGKTPRENRLIIGRPPMMRSPW